MKKIIIVLLSAVMAIACVQTVDVRADEFTDNLYETWAAARARYKKADKKIQKHDKVREKWFEIRDTLTGDEYKAEYNKYEAQSNKMDAVYTAKNKAYYERYDARQAYVNEGREHTLEVDYFDDACLGLVAYNWNEYENNLVKTKLLQKIADQYTEKLGIEPVKVLYTDYSWSIFWIDGIDYKILGTYNDAYRYVTLTDTWLIGDGIYDGRQVIETLLHEIRHAWQHDNGYDFSNYITPDDERNWEAYLNQPVEVDAEAYAEEEMQSILEEYDKIANMAW